ncbi:hypothetical protein ACFMPD_16605 [Sedimentitalea sp. HM32M-2]
MTDLIQNATTDLTNNALAADDRIPADGFGGLPPTDPGTITSLF